MQIFSNQKKFFHFAKYPLLFRVRLFRLIGIIDDPCILRVIRRMEITVKREAEKTFPIMEARNRAIARSLRRHVARWWQEQVHWKLISA